jgi:hypothetical protein
LQALLFYDIPPYREGSTGFKNVRLLNRALSISGDVSQLAAHILVRVDVLVWFQRQETRNILQRAAVWSSLTNVSVELDDSLQFRRQFIQTGHAIRKIPDWQPYIRNELCAWITAFFRGDTMTKPPWDLAEEYGSVLGEICNLPITEYDFVDAGEKALALSLMAIQNFWDASFNLTQSRWTARRLVAAAWLRCTSNVVAQTGYCDRDGQWITIPPLFKALFNHPLATSLMRAADAIRKSGIRREPSHSSLSNDFLESTATTLENLTVKLGGSAGTEELNAAGPSRNEPRFLVDRGNDWLAPSRDSKRPRSYLNRPPILSPSLSLSPSPSPPTPATNATHIQDRTPYPPPPPLPHPHLLAHPPARRTASRTAAPPGEYGDYGLVSLQRAMIQKTANLQCVMMYQLSPSPISDDIRPRAPPPTATSLPARRNLMANSTARDQDA